MDADGSSKKGPPGRRTRKKLKFKPKVPPQKPRKSVPEKPNLEQSKPIDEELMKRLKKKPFHITRAVPLDAIPGNFLKASLAPLLWIIAQYIPQESHKNEQGDTRRMLLFQLPKSLPLPRISAAVERNGKARDKEVKEGSNLKELPQGYLGKMVVYKSGKIKMKLGDVMFDVNPGEECRMAQHVAAINTKEKHCCLLGEIESRHVVVTPDVDSLLLNDNRDLTKAFIEMSFPTGLPKRHVAQGPGRYTHTRPYDGPIKAAGTSTGLTQAMVPLLKPPLKPCPSMKTGGFFFIFNFF
uniref:DNA-directed RNA polymerase III subunit RPC4 n=1 Tax=Oryza rufipogon TaxID=4529 RepID=A0A0E0N623_ORYRU